MWILVFVTLQMTAVYAPDDKHPFQFKTLEECRAKGIEIGDEIHQALPQVPFKAQCMKVETHPETDA